ncbi:hypothetical protein BKA69DRAFT_1123374 [Paraphysoderma sedebokerense]|nr:hypothetical protein BKA69DRAFT_1123374 [Paraphysoderma sedebokerense]
MSQPQFPSSLFDSADVNFRISELIGIPTYKIRALGLTLHGDNFGVTELTIIHTINRIIQTKKTWIAAMEIAVEAGRKLNLITHRNDGLNVVLELEEAVSGDSNSEITYPECGDIFVEVAEAEKKLNEQVAVLMNLLWRHDLIKDINIAPDHVLGNQIRRGEILNWRSLSFTKLRLRVLKQFSTKKRWLPLQPSLSVANIGVQQQSQVRSNCTNRAGDQLISDFSVSRRSSLSHLDRRPSTLVHYGRLNTNVAPNPILMAALTNMGIASPVTPVTPQFPASEFVPVPGKLQIDIEPKTVANLVDHAKFRKADYHNSVQTPTSALPSAASVSSNESDGISPLFFDKSRYYVS